jgi:hypothetical protein
MKASRFPIAILAVLFLSVCVALAPPVQSSKAAREFMRKKLQFSGKVFEGVVLEKYGEVATNAIELSRVVETNSYLMSRDVYYMEATEQFRKDVAQLYSAALATNSPEVLAAYNQVTSDCLACHQQFQRAHLPRVHGRN